MFRTLPIPGGHAVILYIATICVYSVFEMGGGSGMPMELLVPMELLKSSSTDVLEAGG